MATLKQIRQRIRTARSIQQITRAMKLVAAARLTRAKNRVEEARPYSEKIRRLVSNIGSAGELPAAPLLERRPVKRYALVVISSDRGLAGSYNTNVIRKADEFLANNPGEHLLITVGKKATGHFSKRGDAIAHQIEVPASGATLQDGFKLTNLLRGMFESEEVDAVHLCYSRFHSAMRQEPMVTQLLPIEDIGQAEGEPGELLEYVFEPQPKELLGFLLPKYLLTLVWQVLLEAAASEHGARMTAMSSATDNAEKMIDRLTLTANRVRQTAITTEILEIVGGANALQQ